MGKSDLMSQAPSQMYMLEGNDAGHWIELGYLQPTARELTHVK